MAVELRIALHVLEHNIFFITAEHIGVFEKMFPDSKVAKNMKCKRHKLSCLINDAMAASLQSSIVKDCCGSDEFYSLCIDESNDTLCSRKFLQINVFLSL
jgi:hypothetical protein